MILIFKANVGWTNIGNNRRHCRYLFLIQEVNAFGRGRREKSENILINFELFLLHFYLTFIFLT